MLKSSIILGLSTYALALNIRRADGYGNTDVAPGSKSLSPSEVYTPATSSKPTPVHNAPGYGHSVSGIPYPTGANNTSVKPGPTGTPDCAPYWLEDIKHQGLASFNPDPDSYQVFRNVKDFGAKGKQWFLCCFQAGSADSKFRNRRRPN
jgi:glucan 1,3-beta-glucosidase